MKKIDLKIDFYKVVKRIEKLHEFKVLKPSEWADRVGVSRSVVSNIHGKTDQKPSIEYIIAVSNTTGRSVEFLLYGIENNQLKFKNKKIGVPEAESIIFKDRAIEAEEKTSDFETRLAALEEAIKKSALYNKDGIEDETDLIQRLRTENENLKTDNEHLKFLVRASSQDFKDVIDALNQIFEKHLPPDTIGERRECMAEIENLLTGTQSKIKNIDSREE